MGFLEQFLNVFSELKGKNFYVAGESVCNFLSEKLDYHLIHMPMCSMLASVRNPIFPSRSSNLFLSKDVPYIANWIYEHPGLDLQLKGIWIADPTLSSGVMQQEIPALRFVQV